MGLFVEGLDTLVRKGDFERVKKSIAGGADVNRASKTPGRHHRRPLHTAAHSGHFLIVHLLLEKGAYLNVQDDFGQTPLHHVARTHFVEVAALLLRKGADHTVRDKYGNLAIHVAMSARQSGMQECLWKHAVEHPLEVRYFEGARWHPYDDSAAKAVSFELGEGSAYCALVTTTGTPYIVDFRQQMQINANSLFAKSICWRVPPYGAWNYPQKPFQGLHPGSQDPRYLSSYGPLLQELRSQGLATPTPSLPPPPIYSPRPASTSYHNYPPISNNQPGGSSRSASVTPFPELVSPSLIRSFSLDSSPTPGESLLDPHRPSAPPEIATETATEPESDSERDPSKPHFLAAKPAMFKALRSGSEEYNEVVARFTRGMEKQTRNQPGRTDLGVNSPLTLRPITVTCVYKVRAPEERIKAYNSAVSDRQKIRGNANERLAWHGAPFGSLEHIVLTGFKLSPQSRNGRLYGQGIYFAPERRAYTSAEFAVPDENGEKHMLLCRVIVGAMEVVPFESVQRRPSNSKFDTGTDNANEPTRYVVWEDDVNEHVLPTHIVTFKYC